MACSKVVIVYSPGQARRRTVIIPDDDSQVKTHTKNLQPGEAVIVIPLGLYKAIGPDKALAQVLGRSARSDRHVIVNGSGVVIGEYGLDLAIDRHLAHRAIPDPTRKLRVGDGIHHQAQPRQ